MPEPVEVRVDLLPDEYKSLVDLARAHDTSATDTLRLAVATLRHIEDSRTRGNKLLLESTNGRREELVPNWPRSGFKEPGLQPASANGQPASAAPSPTTLSDANGISSRNPPSPPVGPASAP